MPALGRWSGSPGWLVSDPIRGVCAHGCGVGCAWFCGPHASFEQYLGREGWGEGFDPNLQSTPPAWVPDGVRRLRASPPHPNPHFVFTSASSAALVCAGPVGDDRAGAQRRCCENTAGTMYIYAFFFMISLESGPDVLLVLILTILIQISKNHRLRPGRSRFWFRLRSNRPSSRPPATMLTYDPIPAPAPDLAFQGPDPGSAVFDVYTTASTGPPESAESAPAPPGPGPGPGTGTGLGLGLGTGSGPGPGPGPSTGPGPNPLHSGPRAPGAITGPWAWPLARAPAGPGAGADRHRDGL